MIKSYDYRNPPPAHSAELAENRRRRARLHRRLQRFCDQVSEQQLGAERTLLDIAVEFLEIQDETEFLAFEDFSKGNVALQSRIRALVERIWKIRADTVVTTSLTGAGMFAKAVILSESAPRDLDHEPFGDPAEMIASSLADDVIASGFAFDVSLDNFVDNRVENTGRAAALELDTQDLELAGWNVRGAAALLSALDMTDGSIPEMDMGMEIIANSLREAGATVARFCVDFVTRPLPNMKQKSAPESADSEIFVLCDRHDINRAAATKSGNMDDTGCPLWAAYNESLAALRNASPATLDGVFAMAEAASHEADGDWGSGGSAASDLARQVVEGMLRLRA